MKSIYSLLWVVCGLISLTDVRADSHIVSSDEPKVMFLEGAISKNMERSVRETVRTLKPNAFPTPLIVLLDSPGGDGMAAMAIGEMLRQVQAHVFVVGQCASACVFILAGGSVRVASAYTVGLHRGRVTISDADGKVKKELSTDKGSDAQQVLKEFERQAADYFLRMGMAATLFETMQRFERRSVYRLNTRELNDFGLEGVEPDYLAKVMERMPQQAAGGTLTAEEFWRRIRRIPTRCGIYERNQVAFVQCYRQNLIDPY